MFQNLLSSNIPKSDKDKFEFERTSKMFWHQMAHISLGKQKSRIDFCVE